MYYNKFLEDENCNLIFNYLKQYTSQTYKKDTTYPWQENNSILYQNIKNYDTKKLVRDSCIKLSISATLRYDVELYPHYSDLVLWNKGKSLSEHVDDDLIEYREKVKIHNKLFWPRYISTFVYLNDDFEGGKIIVGEKEITPKKGYALMFRSNIPHRVTEITKGKRGVMANWFTKDYSKFYL